MNAINTDSIKIFIDANVYNAIQAKVIDLKWEKFKVEVKEDECKCGDQIIKGYSAHCKYEDGDVKWSKSVAAPEEKDYEAALVHVIGVTTVLLAEIKEHFGAHKKPILTVIQGGK